MIGNVIKSATKGFFTAQELPFGTTFRLLVPRFELRPRHQQHALSNVAPPSSLHKNHSPYPVR